MTTPTNKTPLMNIGEMNITPGNLQKLYLTYINSYTSYAEFAEYEDVSVWYMTLLLDAGRECHRKIKAAHARIDEQAGYDLEGMT